MTTLINKHSQRVSHFTGYFPYLSGLYRIRLRLWQIRNPTIFAEIRPSPALAKFPARFGRYQCSCSSFIY